MNKMIRLEVNKLELDVIVQALHDSINPYYDTDDSVAIELLDWLEHVAKVNKNK